MSSIHIWKDRNIKFSEIKPFDVSISYRNIELKYEPSDIDHTHNLCEIYINLAGNVSFMVENSIYPICSGDAIISRPNEMHHCIHHHADQQEFFWILFSADENKELFDLFFDRPLGKKNHISFSLEKKAELISLCNLLIEDNSDSLMRYIRFFQIIDILRSGKINEADRIVSSPEISAALAIIESNLCYTIQVQDVAKQVHLSIATLERYFKKYIGTTPTDYICKKKLSLAAYYLSQGYSVKTTAEQCGFSDCSRFISSFKLYFNVTPHKYKLNMNKQ